MADYRISRFAKSQTTTQIILAGKPLIFQPNRDRIAITFFAAASNDVTFIGVGYTPTASGGVVLEQGSQPKISFDFRADGCVPQGQFTALALADQGSVITVIELFLPEWVLETELSKYQ